MCGIVGYIGKEQACSVIVEGLKNLEYRGYDSAGVAIYNNGIEIHKSEGNIARLEQRIPEGVIADCGIAHTRWATHGKPTTENAHPHLSYSGSLSLVHNGIIENYQVVKRELEENGITFYSETDSEVLLNLIDYEFQLCGDLFEAIKLASVKVEGSYAFALINKDEPQKIYASRKGSPLIVGKNETELLIASDALAIGKYIDRVYYPEDNDILILSEEKGIECFDLYGTEKQLKSEALNHSLIDSCKGEFEDYMLKEIFEQPESLKRSFSTVISQTNHLDTDSLRLADYIKSTNRIIILGCGTSWHAGLIGKYLIEKLARIPVEVEYASEFRYRHPVIGENDLVVSISQSGETADTLAANRLAVDSNAKTLGICNVRRSTLTRETDFQLYLNAGSEIGVASTKAFTSQVSVLTQLALFLAKQRKGELNSDLLREIELLPSKINELLLQTESIRQLALKYSLANNFLFIGRGVNYPVALEGALKLKEISYIHAEGYPGAEMKHGPIALIDWNFPTFAIVTDLENREKMISNIQEIQARNGRVIALTQQGDEKTKMVADEVVTIPTTADELMPILSAIPLQLFSYYTAKMRGCNVDQPRNLAKSVTVE